MTAPEKEDAVLLAVALLMTALALLSWACRLPIAPWLPIAASDLYLFVVLVLAAQWSDHGTQFKTSHPWVTRWFPRRTAGFFLVLCLLASIVFGFAGLYVGTAVFAIDTSRLDALYISFQTLGFSDFKPTAGYGQVVVLLHLLSGVLLLIGAFPLLISRMSTFESS